MSRHGQPTSLLIDYHGVITDSALPGIDLPELQESPAVVAALELLETGKMGMADFLALLPQRTGAGRRLTLRPRPAVLDAVASLRARGVRVALITNSFRGLRGIRASHGVPDGLFDTVVESWEVGFRKPAAEIFDTAVGRLDTTRNRCLLLDDEITNVESAERLGLRAELVAAEDEVLEAIKRFFPKVAGAPSTSP